MIHVSDIQQHVMSHTLMTMHPTTTNSTSTWWHYTTMINTIQYKRHMECKNKGRTWNKHTQAIHFEGWNMLWYHFVVSYMTQRECNLLWYNSVTPSSHICPSNWPTEVNMWWEATIIWFNLLGILKEVKLTETHQTYLPHQQQHYQEPSQPHKYHAPGSHWVFKLLNL